MYTFLTYYKKIFGFDTSNIKLIESKYFINLKCSSVIVYYLSTFTLFIFLSLSLFEIFHQFVSDNQ